MNNKIEYCEIIALGFNIEECNDSVYFNQYGFQYCIITLPLTKTIYIEWAKETQLAEIVVLKSKKSGDIIKSIPIRNLQHLKDVIECFSLLSKQSLE